MRWVALIYGEGLQLMPYDDAAREFGAYREGTFSDDALAQYELVCDAWSELVGHIASCLVYTLSSSLDPLLRGLSRP